METNRSTHQASGSQPPASQRPQGVGGCYLTPPPLEDVLFEQLHYLISHASQDCPAGCAICHRLSRVLAPLLEPFRA
jgi:hypothetical protein